MPHSARLPLSKPLRIVWGPQYTRRVGTCRFVGGVGHWCCCCCSFCSAYSGSDAGVAGVVDVEMDCLDWNPGDSYNGLSVDVSSSVSHFSVVCRVQRGDHHCHPGLSAAVWRSFLVGSCFGCPHKSDASSSDCKEGHQWMEKFRLFPETLPTIVTAGAVAALKRNNQGYIYWTSRALILVCVMFQQLYTGRL